MSTTVIAKINALIERATRDPHGEEGRTAAVIAVQLIIEHDLLSATRARDVEFITVPAPITEEDVARIIRDHQRERARRGGEARATRLTDARLSEIATKGARARWGTRKARKTR